VGSRKQRWRGIVKVSGGMTCRERPKGWGKYSRCEAATAMEYGAAEERASAALREKASVLKERDGDWGQGGHGPFWNHIKHSINNKEALTTAVVASLVTS